MKTSENIPIDSPKYIFRIYETNLIKQIHSYKTTTFSFDCFRLEFGLILLANDNWTLFVIFVT